MIRLGKTSSELHVSAIFQTYNGGQITYEVFTIIFTLQKFKLLGKNDKKNGQKNDKFIALPSFSSWLVVSIINKLDQIH